MTADVTPERTPEGQPSGKTSLLDVYALREFANSVARQDPNTGAKRKLRKSYKNHIADLPGKHPVPGPGETAWTSSDAALRPAPQSTAEASKSLDFVPEILGKSRFQKSVAPLPSFDPKSSAAPGSGGEGTPASNGGIAEAGASPAGTPKSKGVNSPRHSRQVSRTNSPSPDDARSEKRKRKEQLAAEKRRRL